MLDALHEPRFADQAPAEVFARLLDEDPRVAAIQSGPRCERVASAYVKFEAPSTATNSSTSIRSPVFSSQMHGFFPE